jgi:hypothetical protein
MFPDPRQFFPEDPQFNFIHSEAGSWLELTNPDKLPTVVSDLVPAGYEAYVRLFHPIQLPGSQETRTWQQVCAELGIPREPGTTMRDLAAALPEGAEQKVFLSAIHDTIGGSAWHQLGQILLQQESTCTLYVGISAILGRYEPEVPLWELSNARPYYLATWPAMDWDRLDGAAMIIWPEDRDWVFHNEYGGKSSYIAGPQALMAQILDAADFEAVEVKLSDRTSY